MVNSQWFVSGDNGIYVDILIWCVDDLLCIIQHMILKASVCFMRGGGGFTGINSPYEDGDGKSFIPIMIGWDRVGEI